MIKNIVFDMGGVLIRWDPVGFVQELGLNDADSEMLMNSCYKSPYWPKMDDGSADEIDCFNYAKAHLPERLHGYAEKLIYHWCDPMQPIAGMADFVKELKQAGKGIYLLSNASRRQREYWPEVPGSEMFDGRIVSAEVECVKPEKEIFEKLLETYGLEAQECVFIDDMWQNVLGAMKAGLHGVVFDGDLARLRRIFSYML